MVPGATDLVEPSGRVIAISAMDGEVTERCDPSLEPGSAIRASPGRGLDAPALVAGPRRCRRSRSCDGSASARAGGVLVDVVLARQLADLVHQLVGDLAEHEPVVGAVA